jgi:hypothetical protein
MTADLILSTVRAREYGSHMTYKPTAREPVAGNIICCYTGWLASDHVGTPKDTKATMVKKQRNGISSSFHANGL